MEAISTNVCSHIKPRDIRNCLDYEIMLASHDWKLERTDENGRNGILISMRCKRCGTDRISVLSPKNPGPPTY